MAITPQPEGTIDPPNTLTKQAEGSVAVPNVLTKEAEGSVAVPNTLTPEAAGSVAIPNTLNPEAAGSVAIPNVLTKEAAGSVAVPNVLTKEAAGSVAIPNVLNSADVAGFPRALIPKLCLNFAQMLYAQCGNEVSFEDLFTYSRNTTATFINRRIGSCGKFQYFVDTDYVGNVENFATYSEQIDNADWTKANTATVVPNSAVSSDGTRTADLVYPGSSGALRGVFNTITGRNTNLHTTSFDLKAAGLSWVRVVGATGSAGAWFNLTTGSIGTSSSLSQASIEYLGDGWYRCSVTNVGAATSFAQLILADGDNTDSVTADGTKGVYVSRAQLTESAKPLPYVQTTASAVTESFTESLRLEYDPNTGESLGALIEGSNTNLVLRSEEFDNASWSSNNSSVSANQIVAPDGTMSADKIVEDGTDSHHHLNQSLSVSSGVTYAYSVFAKAGERRYIRIARGDSTSPSAGFDLVDGAATAGGVIEHIRDGWYRCSIAGATGGTSGGFTISLSTSLSGSVVTYAGDGTSGAYVWGAQLEQFDFATSYIRTEGSTASRSSDNLSIASIGNFNIGSLYIDADVNGVNNAANQYMISIGSDSNNSISFLARTTDANVRLFINESGNIVSDSVAPSDSFLNQAKAVTTFSQDDVKAYANGSIFSTDTDAIIPIVTQAQLGSTLGAGSHMRGHLKQVNIYDVELTAQEVALL